MATERIYTYSDRGDFFRMSTVTVDHALKVLRDVLQKELETKYPNVFDFSTGLLNGVLGDRTVETVLFRLSPKIFNRHQREQLYPAGNPSTSVTVGDLDLTLTVLLLRNITSLNPCPRLNALDNPSDINTLTEATIGRMKRYRNTVYGHANKAAISDQDFRTYFSEPKFNLLVLSSRFTNENYDATLSKPLHAALLARNQNIFKEWYCYDKDVKATKEEIPKHWCHIEQVQRKSEGTVLREMRSGTQRTHDKLEKIGMALEQSVEITEEIQEKLRVIYDNDRDRSELQKITVLSSTQEDPAVPSSQLFNPSSSTEKEITQSANSSPTSVDMGTVAASKLHTTKPDIHYQAPVMNPTHEILLVQMGPLLKKNLQVGDIILGMVDRRILRKRNAEKSMAQKTKQDQALECLLILTKRGPTAFGTMVEVLRKHKKEIADQIAEKATACSSKNPTANVYIDHMSQIQRFPWDPDDTMYMDDVCVNLQWVQDERKPAVTSSGPIHRYTLIFKYAKQGKAPKRIFIRGMAGTGKTTFTQKMATDWANTTMGLGECDGVLSKYKHLLILNLRSIKPCQTRKGAIESQITCSTENRKAVSDEIMQALDFDTDYVLLVFDGYDEYENNTSKEITGIIYRKRYQDVCTVITTRPWKAEELMNRRIMDSACEITVHLNNLESEKRHFLDYQNNSWTIRNTLVGYVMEKKSMSLVKIPVPLLVRNLRHVPGLEHLRLDSVFMQGPRGGPSICTCHRREVDTEYEAVHGLSQGVRQTPMLPLFSFTGNQLVQYRGFSSILITLNSIKDEKGWSVCLSENLESKNNKNKKTSCHHTYHLDYTLLSKMITQENTVTIDPEFDRHTLTSSVQKRVTVFFNQDRIQQKEKIQCTKDKCTKSYVDEKDDPDTYSQVLAFVHNDLFWHSTSFVPGGTSMLLYPAHLHEYFCQSAQGPPFRMGEEYCYEAVRLSTFKDLPNSVPVPATRLARSGFYYTGNSDEVACFSCGGRLKEWTYGDNPFVRHRNFFPDCPLMKGTETKNVSLFQIDDAIFNGNIEANEDPFPNLARSTPRDHVDNASSLLSSQQALSRSLGIISPEVATPQITPLESSTVAHAGIVRGARSKGDQCAPSTPPNTSWMRNESDRLATFVSWPSGAGVRPKDLARAGFFYLGTEDRVQCAFCEGMLKNWELGDQPMQEHRKYLSTCPFVLGLEVGNIPLEEPSTALPLAVSESQRQTAGGSATGAENATIGPTLGILTGRPKHERYAIEHARVRTFANWPPSRIQRPEALARAGFFYAGFGDNVKCFFCDGGLRNWESQDDPWVEHARWFPRCDFVRQCKGDAFIQMIKDQNSPNNPIPQPQAQDQRAQGASGNYNVEAREIKARLDTPTVQAVLDMGFRRDTVRQAIERRLRDTGDDFSSAASLLDAILKIEDEMNRQTAQGAAALSVIPKEEPGQQTLDPDLSEVPASVTTQKTSQTQNSEKQSKKDNKKKKKKQDAPVPKESDDKETKSLLEENKRLKEERICKICMDEEVSVVFLPCGHLVACVQCAPALRNCAICRTTIKGTVRSILS